MGAQRIQAPIMKPRWRLMYWLYCAVVEPDAGKAVEFTLVMTPSFEFPLLFPLEELAAGMVKLEEEAAKFAVTTPRSL
jgi:hypothetical protein